MSKDVGKRLAQKELDRIAEMNLRNESLIRDSILFRDIIKNNDDIGVLKEKVASIMEKYQIDEPVSSQDGTFVAYPKRVGMSGVDMERVMATGLFKWFMTHHPECFDLNLRKAEAVTGMDLSGYAIRDAYTMYSVSTDEDYQFVVKAIDEYREKKNVQKA